MLARLSVFVGGFTLEAAEALCSDPDEPDVMQGLSSLVDKSLVVIEEGPAGSPRFKLLETVQAYANEKLRERGEVEDAYRRHGEFFLDFARVAGEELRTVRQRQWFLRVSADHPNIDAALRRAFERGDIATGLGLVATWIYSWTVCDSAPYWALFEALHEQHSSLPDDAQAWLLFGLGAGRLQTRPRDAEAPFTEVVELRRSRGDRMEEADAEVFLAEALPPSRKAEAIDHCEHALELYGELHDLWGCGFARIHLGAIALRDGDPARAEAMLREGLAIGRKLDCDHLTGLALCGIGLDELALGRPEAACSAFTEAAQLLLGIYSREGLAYCLDGFAAVALAKGAAEDAAFFLGAADGTRKEIGYGVWPTLRPVVDKISSDVREALGDDVVDKAREMGAAMRTREAVEKGLNLSLTCFGGTGP
jgi:tetratricopeptide (TPR) repeat protein